MQEEISLVELILIVLKHWRIVLILFTLLYFSAVSAFLYKKKNSIFFKPVYSGTDVFNQVVQGYTWKGNQNKDGIREYYDDYTPGELINILFKKGNIQNQIGKVQNITASPGENTIQILKDQALLFNIALNVDNVKRVFEFTSTLPPEHERKSQKFPSNEDINKIHDIVIQSLIDALSDNIITYKIIRNEIISGLSALESKKNKNRDEMEIFSSLSQLFLDYRSPSKEYRRSQKNIYIPHLLVSRPVDGMPLNKFMVFFFFMDLFVCLVLVFLLEFFKKTNLMGEIRTVLRKKME